MLGSPVSFSAFAASRPAFPARLPACPCPRPAVAGHTQAACCRPVARCCCAVIVHPIPCHTIVIPYAVCVSLLSVGMLPLRMAGRGYNRHCLPRAPESASMAGRAAPRGTRPATLACLVRTRPATPRPGRKSRRRYSRTRIGDRPRPCCTPLPCCQTPHASGRRGVRPHQPRP